MKAFVDGNLCNGCGECVEACPEVFALDPATGISTAPAGDIEPNDKRMCGIAADACQQGAITIEGG